MTLPAVPTDDDHQEPRFILYQRPGVSYQDSMKTLTEWVHNLLLPQYGREATSSAPWCPRWWEHPEAVARLHALFMAWHDLTSETYDRSGPSSWHHGHLTVAMDALRNPKGPFAGCKSTRHQAKKIPHTAAYDVIPPQLQPASGPRTTPEFISYLADDEYDVELHKLTSWVRGLIMPNYGLETTSDAPWCPRWWEHQEAVGQFHALWMAWDNLTGWDTTLSGPSIWQRDHLDPTLAAIRHPAGPFAGCRPDAHRAKQPPYVEDFPG